MSTLVGHVAELWRYPVKSMGGEQMEQLELGRRGAIGDRWWAVRNAAGKVASGKTTRRFARVPNLLTMSSHTDPDGTVWVHSPEGERARVDDPVAASLASAVAGQPVTLAQESDVSHFDDMPVHILTDTSLGWLASRHPDADVCPRRFRPNIVVRAQGPVPGAEQPELEWCGHQLRIGGVVMRVDRPTLRCAMTTMAQPGLSFVPSLLKTLNDQNEARMGVYAEVTVAGIVKPGDGVWLGAPDLADPVGSGVLG